MTIRPLRHADAAAYQALRLRALAESPSAFSSSPQDEQDRTQAQVEAFLVGSPERVVLGAFADGALVGLCGVGRETGRKERHRGFIRSLYVDPSVRRQGLASHLLAQACAVAAGWPGVAQLTLAVTAGNAAAETLYTRHGFVPCGRLPDALRVGGVSFDEVIMVKCWTHPPGAAGPR